jgi:hypothetical protein
MTDPKLLEAKIVLIADLNKLDIELSIRAAISYYKEMYGEPKRIWINSKDTLNNIGEIDGIKVELKSGCLRNKIFIL